MKWYELWVKARQPDIYGTDSKGTAASIPPYPDGSKFASIISASNSTAASGASISPSSTWSVSSRGSVPSVPEAHESKAGLPRGLKRHGDHTDQSSSKRSTSGNIRIDDPNKPASGSNMEEPNQPIPGGSKPNTSNNGTKEVMPKAMLQLGINGAEMLRCSLVRRHAFGMVIIDATICGSIDKARFSLEDSTLSQIFLVEYEVDGKDGKFKVRFSSKIEKPLHEVFSLKGKYTSVFPVTGAPGQPPLVAKLYWPNQDRPHEADIIDHARKNPDLANHLPDVFGRFDIDPIGTRRIRDELGISSNSPRRPRLLRIIIMEELSPIIKLRGGDLIIAWAECVRCKDFTCCWTCLSGLTGVCGSLPSIGEEYSPSGPQPGKPHGSGTGI
ncbi:unnamed protein product [Rhizoctonia solani]|uniref:Uncharacterized protein n=1 Tax=Rhizoctonia solani TaxID=456999 RepID=A0A8H3CJ93_9AGAM|nr:unnamed protein product [Rhizoctonia solani]